VNFTGAMIGHTDFSYATLWGANLSDTDSLGANFTGAFLLGVRWPQHRPVPEGWKLNTSSGRLEPAGTDSGQADAKRPPHGGP